MKKAQIKIQEMIFMLIALFLFMTLIGLFAFSIFYANIYKSANKIAEEKMISSLIRVSSYSELICVDYKTNCIDIDKAIILSNKKIYENYFPFSSLYIIRFNAFNKSEDKMIECSFSNYPNCDKIKIYDKKMKNEKKISTFIALCRNEYQEGYFEKCEIGKIIGGFELK